VAVKGNVHNENNGRDKEDKEEANQQDRKDEDENQTNDTSEETVEKKDNKKVNCVNCEESSGANKCSVCDQFVHAVCGSYSEDSEGFGLEVTCNLCVRKNRINIEREGAKSGQEQQAQKNGFSLQLKISSSCYWDKRCGQGA